MLALEVAPACHNVHSPRSAPRAHSLIMEGDSIEVAKIHRVSEVSVASVGCVVPRESCWVLGVAFPPPVPGSAPCTRRRSPLRLRAKPHSPQISQCGPSHPPATAHGGGSRTFARLQVALSLSLARAAFMSLSADFESVTLSVRSKNHTRVGTRKITPSISPLASRLLQGVRSTTQRQRWAVDLLTPLQWYRYPACRG